MAKYEYNKYKIIIDPESKKTQGLRVDFVFLLLARYSLQAASTLGGKCLVANILVAIALRLVGEITLANDTSASS